MKLIYLLSFLTAACASTDGTFIDRGAFTDSAFVVGDGPTKQIAETRALAAIPKTYETTKTSAIFNYCGRVGEAGHWNARSQDYDCESGTYRKLIEVFPRDLELRARFEKENAEMKGTTEYKGVGESVSLAMKDLLQKLPKQAVISSYSIGCTKEIHQDPATGMSSCRGEGNLREVKTKVIQPNAARVLTNDSQ